MKKGLVTMVVALICAMTCVFGLVACDNNENPNENGNNGTQTVAVESVTLNKTELTLEVGGEETLAATVAPDDATDKAVTWSSDNTAIATVENGKVTAIAAGTATITAKAGDKTDTCTVTVKAPLTEDTDFDALISDKVTEDEWKTAFNYASFSNSTIDVVIDGQSAFGLFKSDVEDSVKKYFWAYDEFGGYFIEKDGVSSGYMANENGEWQAMDDATLEGTAAPEGIYIIFIIKLDNLYDSFIYDNEKGAYVNKNEVQTDNSFGEYMPATHNSLEVKFSNGKLAFIKEGTTSLICYNYGTTEVTLHVID